ncbi:MAG: SMP-30/gluconolactonase/LRE family protein [Allosphingosinicella sp.]
MEAKSVWALGCELGEGPVWADGALWFVDIKRPHVYRYDPASAERRNWPAPDAIGFLFPAEGGGFVAGLRDGLHRFDPASGTFARIVEVEPGVAGNRLNDGAVDPEGRLWFGTMDAGERERTGAFYCFARGKLAPTGLEGIAITNGPCLSPDGRILYFVDTLAGTIEAADIGEGGALSGRRPFVRIDPEEGHPDGPTIDAEGCVWISLFGGWEARRYSPGGELIGRVRFPVPNITKIAFGGEDLKTGYATTARLHMKPADLAGLPASGDLFAFPVDVPGLPCPRVSA